MTKGEFIDALSRLDDGVIEGAIDAGAVKAEKNRAFFGKRRLVIALAACAALLLTAGIAAAVLKNGRVPGAFDNRSADPQIFYFTGVVFSKSVFEEGEDIPVTVLIGMSDIALNSDEIIVSSETEGVGFAEGDPVILSAANGDYLGSELVINDPKFDTKKWRTADLPFGRSFILRISDSAPQSGELVIRTSVTGEGYLDSGSIKLYYFREGGRIAFSAKSVVEAGRIVSKASFGSEPSENGPKR